jgi:predicted PurR-regulated permease PerM
MDLQKGFILALIALFGFLSWLMVKPFLGYVLFAAILAFLIHPLHKRLSKKIKPGFSAALLMIMAFVMAIMPLGIASAAIVKDATDLSEDINQS